MSTEKVKIAVITDVYCSDEYGPQPRCCIVMLTQADIDRIKVLNSVCKEHNLNSATYYANGWWFDGRPLFSFDELKNLGDIFVVLQEDYGEISWSECTDPDAEFDFERINTEIMEVTPHGAGLIAYGKYSGVKFESSGFSLQTLEEMINNSEPTKLSEYYFPTGAEVPALEDLPKYLNDEDPGIQMYAREMMKGSNP